MAKYRVTLCSRTGVAYGGLLTGASDSSTALQHSTVLNGGGAASLSPRLDLPLISGGNRRRLSNWASEIVVERMSGPGDLGPVFAGPVTNIKADLDSNQLTVEASPLWAWLTGERLITQTLTYGAWEQVDIAADLITKHTSGLGPAGDIRLAVGKLATGIRLSQQYTAADQKSPGQAVTDIAGTVDGFDFDIVLAVVAGRLIRTWQPYFPRKGRTIETVLTVGRGGLRNFALEEATDIATRVTGVGQLTEKVQAAASVEDAYGIHQRSISLIDEPSQDKLKRQVQDYLNQRLPPVPIVSFAYRPSTRTPYGFIRTGDTVPIRTGRGWCEYDSTVRIISTSTTVDGEGGELVSCTAAGLDGGLS